jgi:hypothetical protein
MLECRSLSDSPLAPLDPKLCQVVGLNQNYTSSAGTAYHVQIEDKGPVLDRVTEEWVRRVNVIVYANYGEPNARIVHGRDHDYPDVRSAEHNRVIEARIQELAAEARGIIEEKEGRQVDRIKALIREYYLTKNEEAKREFEDANALYPFLFSKAWRELKEERVRPEAATRAVAAAPPADGEPEEAPVDVLYPLDAQLRERVIEIERIILELAHDLRVLRERGTADDILLQTCRKLVQRAREGLSGKEASQFTVRRLEMTRNSLMTTWKQVRSRLRPTVPRR